MIKFFKKHFGENSPQQQPYFYTKYPSKVNIAMQDRIVNISHKKKFCFFRIFKAANSTVTASLYKAETGISIHELAELQYIKDNFYALLSSLTEDEAHTLMKDYFIFTFVRNPYTRIVSAYLDKVIHNIAGKKNLITNLLDKPQHADISFEEFLTYLEIGGLKQNAHWARQTDLLPIPLNRFDIIGKTENLSTELPVVLRKIFGKECEIINVKEHATNSFNFLYTVSQRNLDRIYNLYEVDFETFQYPKNFS